MKAKQKIALFTILLVLTLCTTCGNPSGITPNTPTILYITEQRSLGQLPSGKKVVAFTNMSPQNASLEITVSTGGVPSRSAVSAYTPFASRSSVSSLSGGMIRRDMESASRFNANPPPFSTVPAGGRLRAQTIYEVNDTKDFFVEGKYGDIATCPATLKQSTGNCSIWAANAGAGMINSTEITALASKFNTIYPLVTGLFGHENGGGPGGSGGIDGDPKIHILVFDSNGTAGTEGVVGYYWGKDEYSKADIYYSNEMEMIYIDAKFLDTMPTLVYSTLIHEFQHMINFNQKYLIARRGPDTWYNEMLSMLAEDVIGYKIGINPGVSVIEPRGTYYPHVTDERIPLFLLGYNVPVDQWLDGNEVLLSYSAAYAFGAYLIRNYGGPKLIASMASNRLVNHESVTQALRTVNNNPSLSFESALANYAEALLHSSSHSQNSGKKTFDKEPAVYNTDYKAAAFDIWKYNGAGERFDKRPHVKPTVDVSFPGPYLDGPFVENRTYTYEAAGHSILLVSIPDSASGTMSMILKRPNNADIRTVVLGY